MTRRTAKGSPRMAARTCCLPRQRKLENWSQNMSYGRDCPCREPADSAEKVRQQSAEGAEKIRQMEKQGRY